MYGWFTQASFHIASVFVVIFVFGWGAAGLNQVLNVLLLDLSETRAATAVAFSNLTRCLCGAGLSGATVPLILAIGAGWSFSILSLALLVLYPILALFLTNYGKLARCC